MIHFDNKLNEKKVSVYSQPLQGEQSVKLTGLNCISQKILNY